MIPQVLIYLICGVWPIFSPGIKNDDLQEKDIIEVDKVVSEKWKINNMENTKDK